MARITGLISAIWMFSYITTSFAAFVEFSNCLEETIITSQPRLLQFVPLNVSATFNSTGYLSVTYYGNVTGQLYGGTYPGPNDPSWNNTSNPFGKIVDLEEGANKFTTLFTTFNVLSYTPYSAPPARFCNSTTNEACPLAPAFYEDSTDIDTLPAYTVAYNLASSYAFSTIEANTRVQSGNERAQFYACVNARITPDLGSSLRGLLSYLPLGILVVVGVATISAAIFSPWSSVDVFHWSSNYGRDEDVLRLVTPGFGDCLQYIQFVVFTGCLSLHYPGFYQPVVSRLGWSTLLFNESLVTGGNGTTTIVDGIYQYRTDSKRGLDRIIQLIGMSSSSDAWADMMVWLVVIILCVIVLTQVGFVIQWIYRQIKDISREDLRSKNWYFSVGNVVRIVLGYFLLPIVALSMYQFVIASLGPIYAVALAAVVLVLVIIFAGWLAFMFAKFSPRSFLFDDLQTVLLYGPLYNTYRDDAATFALVPIFVNFLRGIAIGAVQDSGVAQIVILAICEVVMILTLNFIRPYPSATSMNVYQTCFSVLRLLTLMFSIAFVPALHVSTASRGWIGYIILLIHACVLIFGFFLNAIQTLIEVIARLAGAGGHGARDAARGGLVKVFGMRQLSRRRARNDRPVRNSMGSNAQILMTPDVEKDEMAMTRSRTRSQSASSNLLLDGNRQHRGSQGPEDTSFGRQTPDGMSTISRLSRTFVPGGLVGLSKHDTKDRYFRPPRRNTNDFMTMSGRPRLNSDLDKEANVVEQAIDDAGEGSSHTRNEADGVDENALELTKSKTDYAVREVDYYYGIRGGPLSGSGGTRKMKTGPADPEGTVSSTREWFKGIMKGKTKEKGKGFEVVRSTKAPPGVFPPPVEEEPVTRSENVESYRDRPASGTERPRTRDSFSTAGESYASPIPRAPAQPPALPAIDTVGGIELPSRIGSEASRKRPRPTVDDDLPAVPPLPRKSSRRGSSPAARPDDLAPPLPTTATASDSPIRTGRESTLSSSPKRLPFTRTASEKRQSQRNSVAVSEISSYMDEPLPDEEEIIPQPQSIERPGSVGYVNQHRASDNIRYSPHEAQIPRLSTVEYGYQPTQPQSQQAQAEPSDSTWSPAWNGSSAYSADGGKRFSRFRD